jgi:hypothetical protein
VPELATGRRTVSLAASTGKPRASADDGFFSLAETMEAVYGNQRQIPATSAVGAAASRDDAPRLHVVGPPAPLPPRRAESSTRLLAAARNTQTRLPAAAPALPPAEAARPDGDVTRGAHCSYAASAPVAGLYQRDPLPSRAHPGLGSPLARDPRLARPDWGQLPQQHIPMPRLAATPAQLGSTPAYAAPPAAAQPAAAKARRPSTPPLTLASFLRHDTAHAAPDLACGSEQGLRAAARRSMLAAPASTSTLALPLVTPNSLLARLDDSAGPAPQTTKKEDRGMLTLPSGLRIS